MHKSVYIVLGIFATILGFILLNDLILTLKPVQPKVTVVSPRIVIQQVQPRHGPTIESHYTPLARQHPSGVLHKLHKLFGGT